MLNMELRFGAFLYSYLVTTLLMRAISNVHAGRRFPTFELKHHVSDSTTENASNQS